MTLFDNASLCQFCWFMRCISWLIFFATNVTFSPFHCNNGKLLIFAGCHCCRLPLLPWLSSSVDGSDVLAYGMQNIYFRAASTSIIIEWLIPRNEITLNTNGIWSSTYHLTNCIYWRFFHGKQKLTIAAKHLATNIRDHAYGGLLPCFFGGRTFESIFAPFCPFAPLSLI